MNRPINIFFDFLKNLKELVVSVKIGSAEATPNGAVLAQLSNTTFKVVDQQGNQGVCELVDKDTKDLDDNEMSLLGFVLATSGFTFIKEIIDNIMIDFDNIQYKWDMHHDSTTNVLILGNG
jgi:hypothetical protein